MAAHQVEGGVVGLLDLALGVHDLIGLLPVGLHEATGIHVVVALEDHIHIQLGKLGRPEGAGGHDVAVRNVGGAGIQGLMEAHDGPLAVLLGLGHGVPHIGLLLRSGVGVAAGGL